MKGLEKKKPRSWAVVSAIFTALMAFMMIGWAPVVNAEEGEAECTTILDAKYCNDDGSGIMLLQLLRDILGIFVVGIGVMGTIGIIVCGILILTAGDNPEKVKKAKQRLIDVVIGVVLAVLLTGLGYLLLPTANSDDLQLSKVIEVVK